MLSALIFLALSVGEMTECRDVLSTQAFRVEDVGAGIYLLRFKTAHEMNRTLLRFSEHQENIHFRAKIFSLKDYKEWYREHGSESHRFTYYSDWAGHNLRAESFLAFIQGDFKYLTQREKALISVVQKLRKPFYLIVNADDSGAAVIEHELSHALFALDPVYRRGSIKILEKIDIYPAYRWLRKNTYHPKVFIDETQAYLLESSIDPEGSEEIFGRQSISKASRKIKDLFLRRIRELGIRIPRHR